MFKPQQVTSNFPNDAEQRVGLAQQEQQLRERTEEDINVLEAEKVFREGVSRPRSLCGVLRVGEMTVKKAPKVEETLTVEEEVQVTELVANLIEVEVPVLEDFPVGAPQNPESHSSEPLPEAPEVHEEPQEEVRGKGKKKGK
jgi:hypothetical protein